MQICSSNRHFLRPEKVVILSRTTHFLPKFPNHLGKTQYILGGFEPLKLRTAWQNLQFSKNCDMKGITNP
jgi:hypothetical protein